jgi:hypothetical protein
MLTLELHVNVLYHRLLASVGRDKRVISGCAPIITLIHTADTSEDGSAGPGSVLQHYLTGKGTIRSSPTPNKLPLSTHSAGEGDVRGDVIHSTSDGGRRSDHRGND